MNLNTNIKGGSEMSFGGHMECENGNACRLLDAAESVTGYKTMLVNLEDYREVVRTHIDRFKSINIVIRPSKYIKSGQYKFITLT